LAFGNRFVSSPEVNMPTKSKSFTRSRRGHTALAGIAKQIAEEMESTVAPTDAVSLLEQDHREVEDFLAKFKKADAGADKAEWARKICIALTVHAEIEESVFYPAVRDEIDEDDMMDEALVEHASLKVLIGEIEGMSPRDKLFEAKVIVLGEYVSHHVKEEEGEMFPKVRQSGLDLEDLAEEMVDRKIKALKKLSRK
jgi:hemerythrin superfamily protein